MMEIMPRLVRSDSRLACYVATCFFTMLLFHGCCDKNNAPRWMPLKDVTSVNIAGATPGSPAATEIMRVLVIEYTWRLSPSEKEMVLTTQPETGLHVMGLTQGEYYWSWQMPGGRTVGARYLGDRNLPIDPSTIFVRQ